MTKDSTAEQGQEGKGLVCPSCGCKHFRTLYTRPGWDNKIIRRRECRYCGRRISTLEKSV